MSLIDPRNWFAGTTGANANRDRVIDTFVSHVSAEAQGLSTAITISARSGDAPKAALIANTLADAYVKAQLATQVNATTATTAWLNGRPRDLAQQLQVQQSEVQRYKAENNFNDSAPGNSSWWISKCPPSTRRSYKRAPTWRSGRRSRTGSTSWWRMGNPGDIGQIVASQLIVQLRTQQSERQRQEADLNSSTACCIPRCRRSSSRSATWISRSCRGQSPVRQCRYSDVVVARGRI